MDLLQFLRINMKVCVISTNNKMSVLKVEYMAAAIYK